MQTSIGYPFGCCFMKNSWKRAGLTLSCSVASWATLQNYRTAIRGVIWREQYSSIALTWKPAHPRRKWDCNAARGLPVRIPIAAGESPMKAIFVSREKGACFTVVRVRNRIELIIDCPSGRSKATGEMTKTMSITRRLSARHAGNATHFH